MSFENANDTQLAHSSICNCPFCSGSLVYPFEEGIEKVPDSETDWKLHLRCPDCDWRGSGIYGAQELDNLDVVLDDSLDTLVKSLGKLTSSNMAKEADMLAEALRVNAILPEDF